MNRRQYLATLGAALASTTAGCVGGLSAPSADTVRRTTGPSAPAFRELDARVLELMTAEGIPGGALAVARRGRLVLARGYGLADREAGEAVEPTSLFRIASVSKPITAAAILRLVDTGRLSLDDSAFDVLDDLTPTSMPVDPRFEKVTIRRLLYHTGGWDVSQLGTEFGRLSWDPMLNPVRIANAQGESPPADPETIVRYMARRWLNFDPGSRFSYSNFGYCVLGRVIEAVSDTSYEEFVVDELLDELDISRMQIGATHPDRRATDEVRYYDHDHAPQVDSVFPDEGRVPRPYGGFHVPSLDAAGGWIASPVDLVRFVTRLVGDGTADPYLSSTTLAAMTERPPLEQWADASTYYAMGWNVQVDSGASDAGDDTEGTSDADTSTDETWWHDGSLPGTVSVLGRNDDIETVWAAVFNKRPVVLEFGQNVGNAIRDELEEISEWPEHDLFDEFS